MLFRLLLPELLIFLTTLRIKLLLLLLLSWVASRVTAVFNRRCFNIPTEFPCHSESGGFGCSPTVSQLDAVSDPFAVSESATAEFQQPNGHRQGTRRHAARNAEENPAAERLQHECGSFRQPPMDSSEYDVLYKYQRSVLD